MIKKFIRFVEGIEDQYDYTDDTPIYDNEDDIESMLSLIRTTLRNRGIDKYFVENRDRDIMISCFTKEEERLDDIITIFDIVYRIKKDILPQYDSEFDMYYSKKQGNILEFGFYYNEGLEDDIDDEEQDRLPF